MPECIHEYSGIRLVSHGEGSCEGWGGGVLKQVIGVLKQVVAYMCNDPVGLKGHDLSGAHHGPVSRSQQIACSRGIHAASTHGTMKRSTHRRQR